MFALSFSYDAELDLSIRQLAHRQYDRERRLWLLPAETSTAQALRNLLAGRGFHTTTAAADLGRRLLAGEEPPGGPRLLLDNRAGTTASLALRHLLDDGDWALVERLLELPAQYVRRAGIRTLWLATADAHEPAARLDALLAEHLPERSPASVGAAPDLDLAAIVVAIPGDAPSKAVLDLKTSRFALTLPYRADTVNEIREVGGTWQKQSRTWSIPAREPAAAGLYSLLVKHAVPVMPRAYARLGELLSEHTRRQELRAEAARLGEQQALALNLPTIPLMPFQLDAVRQMLRWRRALLGDEQGLGKTVELLATLAAAEAFPAVVICPSGLKRNWLAEQRRWLPGRTAIVLQGRKADLTQLHGVDIVILNYELLGAWLPRLQALPLRAMVADESHYLKDPRSARSKAANTLAESIPEDGLVLEASGTLMPGAHRDLINQLDILGALERDFGGHHSFRTRFCGMSPDDHKRDDSASTRSDELHARLKRTVLVRRLKADVLPDLPAKLPPQPIVVDLTNRTDYDRIQSRVVAETRQALHSEIRAIAASNVGEATARKLIAEALANGTAGTSLAMVTALRAASSVGKLKDIIAWCKQFALSTNKLVLFADHIDTQKRLVAGLPGCATLLGGQRDVEEQKARFAEDPDCLQLVCSLKAASCGHTLINAADVAFVDLPWMPSTVQQAIDRCHRIGQRNVVTPWFFLGDRTIDMHIAARLDARAKILAAAVDGDEDAATEQQILLSLIDDVVANVR